jgi:hypothetical protein
VAPTAYLTGLAALSPSDSVRLLSGSCEAGVIDFLKSRVRVHKGRRRRRRSEALQPVRRMRSDCRRTSSLVEETLQTIMHSTTGSIQTLTDRVNARWRPWAGRHWR